jgi:peptidoglycan/LPS O-acetylase OafA/YrhL
VRIASGRNALPEDNNLIRPSHVFGLDAARSVAIFLVVISHFGTVFCDWFGIVCSPYIAAGGFFGVELFFILSGFLVGRILIGVMDRGPSLRAWAVFMSRRWLRTLPLYFVWLAILAVIWRPFFWLPGYGPLQHDLPYFITMTQNLAWPMVDDWFAISWSLSVEEWFYISFSILLLAGVACVGRRWFWGAMAIFLTVSPLLRLNLPTDVNWDEVTSKVVIYRLDAISWGAALAWLSLRRPGWLTYRWTMFAAGAALVLLVWSGGFSSLAGSAVQFERAFIFDVVSLGFVLMLPLAAATHSAWRPIESLARTISAQSYAIYLMHLSVAEMIGYERGQWHIDAGLAAAATCLLTWGLSAASYRWLERPILSLRPAQ